MSWQENKKKSSEVENRKVYIIFDLEIPLVEIYSTFTCYRSKKSYMEELMNLRVFSS